MDGQSLPSPSTLPHTGTRLARWLRGNVAEPSTYLHTRRVFLRLLGLVYLIAFVSLGVQVTGLIGEHGILPAGGFLRAVRENLGNQGYWKVPTLCWFDASDAALRVQCAGGAALALLLIVGVAPRPVLLVLWILYLSLVKAGQTFLSFQWDILLLETGFLAVLFAPRRWWPRRGAESPPSRIAQFLLRWLLFRLMLLSGLVKLWSEDGTWTTLTALDFHYFTQPLPSWTSWYAHHLPSWFQRLSLIAMFIIELAVPFFIFAPRRLRAWAGATLVAFMLLIAATGNYNFFNLLTIALCSLLWDDRHYQRFLPVRPWTEARARSARPWRRVRVAIGLTGAAGLVAWSLVMADQRLVRCPGWKRISEPARSWVARSFPQATARFKASAYGIEDWIGPFDLVNAYGLFQSMTTARPEIVIEGSNDGRAWHAYEFHWKPGELSGRPRFVQPHQPRLDWQMWFAALHGFQRSRWVGSLLQRLLEGSPDVLRLMAKNPFPDGPPRFIRAIVYQYRFTDWETAQATGQWWTRDGGTPYSPVFSRKSG
jgi:hypothetical protein